MSAYRYIGDEVNAKLADKEADILHKAIKDNSFNNDEVIRILTTRSKAQLNATFNRYRDDHKTSIAKVVHYIIKNSTFLANSNHIVCR